MTLILGIESTCDETACAIVRDGKHILSNCVSSQIDLHKEYGGVVPELACRRHIEIIMPVIKEALSKANVTLNDIDAIAVAQGPGLIGALLIGLNTAKALAWALDKPLIGVNHIEAHLYASLMDHVETLSFPLLGVIISGGHTVIIKMSELGKYTLLGQSIDDAMGEAFDKVATLLDLPYPGGPQIERLAREGNPQRYPFKSGKVKGRPFDFSLSGLKTKVLYTVKGSMASKRSPTIIREEDKKDIAASFQAAVFEDLIEKIALANQEHYGIVFGGGVCNNQTLHQLIINRFERVYWPPKDLTLDNAAMIAALGYHQYKKKPQGDLLSLEALTQMPLYSTDD